MKNTQLILTGVTPLILLSVLVLPLGGCQSGQGNASVQPAPEAAQAGASQTGTAATGGQAPAPPKVYGWETFRASNDPDVILAGMPSDEALDIFAARKGAMVINLRTEKEMEAFPGYAEQIEARGLKYVHVPTSGSTLGPETYDEVAAAIAAVDGPVLLHCASGGRATYMWAMHRIDQEGLSGDEAIGWCNEARGGAWEQGAKVLNEFAESRSSLDR